MSALTNAQSFNLQSAVYRAGQDLTLRVLWNVLPLLNYILSSN